MKWMTIRNINPPNQEIARNQTGKWPSFAQRMYAGPD